MKKKIVIVNFLSSMVKSGTQPPELIDIFAKVKTHLRNAYGSN